MTLEVCTVLCGGAGPQLPMTRQELEGAELIRSLVNKDNKLSPCEAYQKLLEESTTDILCYIHDDVAVYDTDWEDKVLSVFQDCTENYTKTVAVGFGGATSLGRPDLYRKPFNIWNMARGGYASNQEDAETHGERITGVRRVAVLDAFFMAVRRDFLRACGGWPVAHLTHHCLDLWLACEVARAGKEIWMTGVKCNHYGGRSSVKPIYKEASWLQGGSLEEDHIRPHKWLYENYRDVLPIVV